MRSFQHYTTGCPEKTERFELLKNMLIYAMHSKTQNAVFDLLIAFCFFPDTLFGINF